MKTRTVVVLAVLAGAVLGSAITWAHFGAPAEFKVGPGPSSPLEVASGPQEPKVSVDKVMHDFGSVARDIKVRHDFKFTNNGTGILTLQAGATSCSRCTISSIEQPRVAPGQTVLVTVEYLPSRDQPHFRQNAPILTNDPDRPRVDLDIFGRVISDYDFQPSIAQFGKVAVTEAKTVELKLLAGLRDTIKIASIALENPETAPNFEVTYERMAADELAKLDVEDGYRLFVTLKPGLPLGPIRQKIRCELSVVGKEENPVYEVGVQGTIASDISIMALGWDEDLARLKLGSVKSREGTTRELSILVRGANRDEIVITPKSIEPNWLQVKMGASEDLPGGKVRRIPLEISIPPGTPPANHAGTSQGKYAKIVLATTHPDAKEIQLFIQVQVE